MRKYIPDIVLAGLLFFLCFFYGEFEPLYRSLFPGLEKVIYSRSSMGQMVGEHMKMVALAGFLSVLTGGVGGLLLWGSPARAFLATLASGCQSFPPVAVLILVSAWVGFGDTPVIVALCLYGLLPVVHGVLSALDSLDPALRTASEALGLTRAQQLLQVEIPLTAGLMLAGVRIMVISHIGTATLGATIGAGGLGAPVIAGLQVGNSPYIIHASACVSLLAVLTDRAFDHLECLCSVRKTA